MSTPDSPPDLKSVRQDIDFYKIFKVFLSRWYWIAGCVIIAMVIAKINVLYTLPIYQTYGSLKLEDANPAISSSNNLSAQMYTYTDRIQNEGFVIRSNDVLLNAIGNLDYKISYYLKGRIKTSESYPNKPFSIVILKQDSVDFSRDIYQITPVNARTFSIRTSENGPKKEYHYNEVINLGKMAFKVTSRVPDKGEYSFKFNTKEDFIGRAGRIDVGEAAKYTNVMNISITDPNPVFAADVLNQIMKEYIKYDLEQKRRSARQTIEFIESQMNLVLQKADTAGTQLAEFKQKNNITDLSSSAQMTSTQIASLESQKSALNLQLIGINQLEDQVRNSRNRIEINSSLEGDVSGLLASLIAQLNSLILSRESKLTQFNPNSEPILELNRQINEAKAAIRNNIRALKERQLKSIGLINSQLGQAQQTLNQLPSKEKKYVQYESNTAVNNEVLKLLRQKKLEAEMNAAAVVPGASIVNLAYPNHNEISAGPSKIYSFAAMIGLSCGIGLILLVRFLNPYIYDKETVEGLTNTPIIGVIRKFPDYIDKDSRQALSLAKPKSVFAESVRSVRTNLSFLAANKKSKTICVTSEVSGEGKSFVTVNLAGTLALIDKKVILIAADLRRSKLHKVFGSDNKIGLSSYLSGQKTLEEVMIHDSIHNIDFIPSGPVPPNPSELLHTENMKELLNLLAPRYDYVLVDTAPVGLVSDAIPLIRQSDVNLFVIRSGKSQFRAAAIPERLSREYGLSNLAIVLNAFGDDALHSNYYTTDYSRGGGNSTYYYSDYSGYAGSGYYDEDPKKWWEFWKKK
ncbi:MAG: polysaccharide biosynthesis tyrosine autokinase [Pedobacter sp.]|nr:polysaccharide biosynthesis tyrosine autokinase [Pedobacter sp.]MDQ8053962.1 polysaccharide biosynthesis tyrosine autokinase [Pedobacter sp.]